MAFTNLDSRQVINQDMLSQLALATGLELENLLHSIHKELTMLLVMSPNTTPNLAAAL